MVLFGQSEQHLTTRQRRPLRRGLCVVWWTCAAIGVLLVAGDYCACQVVGEATIESRSIGSQFREPQIPRTGSVIDQGVEQPAESVIQNFDQQNFDQNQNFGQGQFGEGQFGQSQFGQGQFGQNQNIGQPQNSGAPANNTLLNAPLNSTQDSFVPRETTPSGFVPVRPRDVIDEIPTDADDVIGGLQLDVPSRSKDDEEILSLLRAERIDQAVQATRNKDGSELIKQFYPDGKTQIERYVAQDDKGNYFNHGSWKLYNRRGQVMGKGNFKDGMMNGSWERYHPPNSSGMFQSSPFREFEGPFISTATFRAGKLDGVWAVFDQFQRKIAEIPYKDGLRHGTATWKYPDSTNMRVARFSEGKMDGPLYEWDRESKLVRNDEYINGKRVIKNVTFYRPKQRKSENYFLEGEYELDGDDSWWDAKPAEYVQTGARIQHGPSYAWHENGQLRMRGSYQNNEPVGAVSWWHSNGQREGTGGYRNGLKTGEWTGWHANGMKSFKGQFDDDEKVGMWRWWDEDGKVRAEKDFDQQESTDILREPKKEAGDAQPSSDGADGDQAEKVPALEDYSDAEEISPVEESENFRPGEYADSETESGTDSETGTGESQSDPVEDSSSESGPQFREPDVYRKDPFGEGENGGVGSAGSGSRSGI